MTELPGVSRTAVGVARMRARESERVDALFVDPFAKLFVPPPPDGDNNATPSDAHRALAFQVVVRTRFYDDWLLDAITSGCTQVVVLGAGLDARAFRLPVARDTQWFEVDLPAVLETKARVLAEAGAVAACRRAVVPADVTGDWLAPLTEAGFDPRLTTAWLVEGLLVYLDGAQAEHVLDVVTRASAPGSRLATERVGGRLELLHADDTAAATGLWRGGLDAIDGWLTAHGWDGEAHALTDVAAGYGRPMSRPSDSGFVTAIRDP